MRVGKVLLVLVAALVSGVVGYGHATLSNQLAPNRSYDLPAEHRTWWDWKKQHVLFFAVDQTRAANNRTELRLSGRATAYDPVSGETFPVEQSDCLTEYF